MCADAARFAVQLRFHGDLSIFLGRHVTNVVERPLGERTSIKDVIEACGVPHPEVDLILVNGEPVDFGYVLGTPATVEVHGVGSNRSTFFPENRLQTRKSQTFVCDGHLGTLTRDLRLLGFDVLYDSAAEDRQLVKLAGRDRRALLTRDRRLLMHGAVRHGYFLRSQEPLEQAVEVIDRFDLLGSARPFTRCLRCNAELQSVEKAEVLDSLEPLTKLYYEQFRRCGGCAQIYWGGSHFDKLRARIEEIRARASTT